ncbi:MAG TPA: hypothetical protein ENJ95_06780 [Bacteroidetes bacterium]|nr:hypothetical protein [Bacteroidota bacterium]
MYVKTFNARPQRCKETQGKAFNPCVSLHLCGLAFKISLPLFESPPLPKVIQLSNFEIKSLRQNFVHKMTREGMPQIIHPFIFAPLTFRNGEKRKTQHLTLIPEY